MSEMGLAMMGTGVASGENRARQAAEAAIASPLLEDVNLAGARGILVNVTAGLDLSIGEFDEVGSAIREFASEDATVVVGTVIDPDLKDELRVTVVATGIGRPASAVQAHPEAALRVVRKTRDGGVDYEQYQTPAIERTRGKVSAPPARAVAGSDVVPGAAGLDYLDIPAFLRRQAD